MKSPKRTMKKRRIMGGAMPGPARLPPIGGLGRNMAESAGYSLLNTMVTPLRTALGQRKTTNPAMPKPPVDTSAAPTTYTPPPLYKHPAAKTGQPRTTAYAGHTSKGKAKGGARPV